MSPTGFRDRFEEKVHGLLWRQWSPLGVAGASAGDDRWIIDPEALLLITLESARTEPRLFDEVLDWLLKNGDRIDVQRLGNLMDGDEEYPRSLLGAVASKLAEQDTSAKWKRMAGFVPDPGARKVPLFQLSHRDSTPPFQALDLHFERAGYLRSPFKARGLSGIVPVQSAPCLRFQLRAFFGIGIRAEAIAFLLTHPDHHADDVARAIGYSIPGVQQVLREMGETGMVHARRAGREKRYWLDLERWSDFLNLNFVDSRQLAARSEAAGRLSASYTATNKSTETGDGARKKAAKNLLKGKPAAEAAPFEEEGRSHAILRLSRPEVAWAGWSRMYRGLVRILRHLRQSSQKQMTHYLQASEFARAVEGAKNDLEAAEKGFHIPGREGNSLEAYVSTLERLLESLVG